MMPKMQMIIVVAAILLDVIKSKAIIATGKTSIVSLEEMDMTLKSTVRLPHNIFATFKLVCRKYKCVRKQRNTKIAAKSSADPVTHTCGRYRTPERAKIIEPIKAVRLFLVEDLSKRKRRAVEIE